MRGSLAVVVLSASWVACEPGEALRGNDARADAVDAHDETVTDAGSETNDATLDVLTAPDALDAGDAVAPVDVTVPEVDEAAIASEFVPSAIGCHAHASIVITVQNTGTSTWTAASGYALVAVSGSDPIAVSPRVDLAPGDSIAPGATHDFVVPIAGSGTAGTVTTQWQMSRVGVHAFGANTRDDVIVSCDTVAVSDFALDRVNIVASPDVRSFAVTSHITSLTFGSGTIHVDHERRGMWPAVVIADDGTTQEATIWVFFHIAGQWYATGGERLRPNQTDKALPNPSSIGTEWLYDRSRWQIMTGYVPTPGDLVGFMVVAGSTRSDNHVEVMERTGVVLVPFPSDDVTTSFPPFAWTE